MGATSRSRSPDRTSDPQRPDFASGKPRPPEVELPGQGRLLPPRPQRAHVTLRAPAGNQAGFTLLELLVVVVMVAILTGTVILGFTGADTEQRLKGSADQLAYSIELARQYALQRNREWGLYVEPDAIRFVEFDPETGTWVERTGRPFGEIDVLDNVELRVQSEGFDQLADEDQEDLPKVILFSSGEVTPFTIFMEPRWDVRGWEVSSDGISRTAAERAEY